MIDLTPLEVRKKKGDFRRSMRGYDAQSVDDFLDLVADRLEQLVRENAALRERVTAVEGQVSDFRERERALTEALVTAQEMREEMRKQIEREVELKRREAEADAEAIRNEAAQLIEREEESIRRLRARQSQFVQSYRTFLERELAELSVMAESLDPSAEGSGGAQRKRGRRTAPPSAPAQPVTPAPAAPKSPPPTGSAAATGLAAVAGLAAASPTPAAPAPLVAPPAPRAATPKPEAEPLPLLSFPDEPFEPEMSQPPRTQPAVPESPFDGFDHPPVESFQSFEPYQPFEREPVEPAPEIEFEPEAEEPLIDLTQHFQTEPPKAQEVQDAELELTDEMPPDDEDEDDRGGDDGGWVSTLLEGKGE